LTRCGIEPASIELIHINRDYVFPGGEIDWHRFFARSDIAEQVAAEQIDMADAIRAFHNVLARPSDPDVAPGPHFPKHCDYWEHCTANKPADWIMNLLRISATRFADLTALGIERISDIPDDINLTEHQDRLRDCIVSGRPYVSDGLANALAPLDGPASYLDFEAMNPAIPIYPETHPYDRLSLQWSLHRKGRDAGPGDLAHEDYLAPADPALDPRPGFTASLIDALSGDTASIVVYSPYARTVLQEMARRFPGHAPALEGIIARLVDLLVIVRDHVYLAGFSGSFSIKTVGATLAPHLSYDGLADIANGEQAAATFQRLILGSPSTEERARLADALLAYCRLDTLTLVETRQALKRLANRTSCPAVGLQHCNTPVLPCHTGPRSRFEPSLRSATTGRGKAPS
jgi:hypothetical protein